MTHGGDERERLPLGVPKVKQKFHQMCNFGSASHQYGGHLGIRRLQMQKRTSEMDFSAHFESIHVVSDFIFEQFQP